MLPNCFEAGEPVGDLPTIASGGSGDWKLVMVHYSGRTVRQAWWTWRDEEGEMHLSSPSRVLRRVEWAEAKAGG